MMSATMTTRIAQVEQRLNDIDRKLDRLISAMTGDGINTGFVGETRKDIHELNLTVQALSQRSLSATEMHDLRKVLSMLTGWKLTIGLLLWLAPLITITIKILLP
jgi:hypothetical protein